VYTNAEMEYRAADSTMISIAICGLQLAPGICETIRIRMTIITVDKIFVITDSIYELINTAFPRLSEITCGVTAKPNSVIPRAESIQELIHSREPSHTY
jgi:hypothetical protein